MAAQLARTRYALQPLRVASTRPSAVSTARFGYSATALNRHLGYPSCRLRPFLNAARPEPVTYSLRNQHRPYSTGHQPHKKATEPSPEHRESAGTTNEDPARRPGSTAFQYLRNTLLSMLLFSQFDKQFRHGQNEATGASRPTPALPPPSLVCHRWSDAQVISGDRIHHAMRTASGAARFTGQVFFCWLVFLAMDVYIAERFGWGQFSTEHDTGVDTGHDKEDD